MKKLLQKYLPDQDKLRNHKSLRFLSRWLADPRLWHFNRRTVPPATFIGIFVCLLPMPFHMVVAALLAIRSRCNLPLAVALVWINTPFTYVPVFYFNYRVGSWLMQTQQSGAQHAITAEWLFEQLWPLWVGSLVVAGISACVAFLLVKLGWRLSLLHHLHKRKQRNN